jgi:hypothetical protein
MNRGKGKKEEPDFYEEGSFRIWKPLHLLS